MTPEKSESLNTGGEVQEGIKEAGLTASFMPGTDLYIMKVSNKQAVFTDRVIEEDKKVADTVYTGGISVMTEQQSPIPLDISCLYQLNPKHATKIMKEYGEDGVWEDKLVIREVRSTIRDEIGTVSLEKLNSNRGIYEEKIRIKLNAILGKNGITVTTFNIQNIGIPQAIQEAVLAKETAKQNAEKAKYQVIQATAEAEVDVAKAKGIAQANDILAGSLTDRLVKYKELEIQRVQADKWNGAMPSTVVSGNTPMMLGIK